MDDDSSETVINLQIVFASWLQLILSQGEEPG